MGARVIIKFPALHSIHRSVKHFYTLATIRAFLFSSIGLFLPVYVYSIFKSLHYVLIFVALANGFFQAILYIPFSCIAKKI